METSKIKDISDSIEVRKIKMQFWREEVEKVLDGKESPHPLSQGLQFCAQNIPSFKKYWIIKMLNAKEKDLTLNSYFSLNSIEEYSESTIGSLFYLLLDISGCKNVQLDHCFSHISKGIGITTFLRSAIALIPKKQINLPVEVFARHGVLEEDFLSFKNSVNLQDAVFEIASAANNHFKLASKESKSIEKFPKTLSFLALPSIKYLQRLEKLDCNLFDPKSKTPFWNLSFILYYHYFFNKTPF